MDKVSPERKKFFFSCNKCGEYEVTEKEFYLKLFPRERADLQKRLAKENDAAKIIFKGGVCPRCKPKRSSVMFHVDLAVGKTPPKVMH